ncbi:Ankyrin repeat-containing protein [Quillaja saponaria]|uniref:Ankyrin repeat-containing protein n=1 Tax=Quillaja saponaria TaxID=32244 RepID=A0AAD7QHA3_QUISA|nr:Ankyrin repeat-containing protein [Quillaja saponaria]
MFVNAHNTGILPAMVAQKTFPSFILELVISVCKVTASGVQPDQWEFMDNLNIPMDISNGSWRERCKQRIQNLKANDRSSIPNSSVERQANKHMIPELYDAIKEGDVDHFVDSLERVLQEKKLHLIAISDQVTPAENSMLHLAIIFFNDNNNY